MAGQTESNPRLGDHPDRDLARERSMDAAYSANELLWALARKKVRANHDTAEAPRRYVLEAIEEAYDTLEEEYRSAPVLTVDDWRAGPPDRAADERLELEVAG